MTFGAIEDDARHPLPRTRTARAPNPEERAARPGKGAGGHALPAPQDFVGDETLMDTQRTAIAAADALGLSAAASLNRTLRACGAGTFELVGHPTPNYLRRAFADPVVKASAKVRPHPALNPFAPPHPALDAKNALRTGEK